MEIPDDIDWALIAKYVIGDATPAEIEIVERWAASDPDNAAELDALRVDAAAAPQTPPPEFDVDAAWAKTPIARARAERASAERASAESSRRVSGRGPRMRPHMHLVAERASPVRRALPWVAAAALVAAVPIAWRVVRDRRAELAQQASSDDRVYETKKGERSRIELADGTTVAMAAETRLRVSSRFGDERRDVFLTGEALFDVAHDATKPFAVHAANLVAQDVGTQFGIRAYAGTRVQVVVAKGAVSLGLDRTRKREPGAPPVPDLPPVTLGSGDLGQLDSTGQILLEHGVDVTRYLGWSEGRLQYQLAPLGEIINDLNRWYDVDIRLADSSLATTRVTMSVTGKSIDDVMTVLAAALALQVERHGRVIRMY